MPKYKAPEDAGTGCSIGGRWFAVEDGILSIPDDDGGDYGAALGSLGYVGLPHDPVEQAAPSAAAGSEAGGAPEVDAAAGEGASDAPAEDASETGQEGAAGEGNDAGAGEGTGDAGSSSSDPSPPENGVSQEAAPAAPAPAAKSVAKKVTKAKVVKA